MKSGMFRGLKFQTQAGLNSVGRVVVFIKARDHRVSKKAATGNRAARAEAERSSVRVSSSKHPCERNLRNVWCAGKGKETRCCVQSIFVRPPRICPRGAAASGRLTGQQRHGNNSMEDPCAAAQNNVVLSAKVIGEAGSRIEFFLRTVQHLGRKCFELVAEPVDQIDNGPYLPSVM